MCTGAKVELETKCIEAQKEKRKEGFYLLHLGIAYGFFVQQNCKVKIFILFLYRFFEDFVKLKL